MNKFLIHFLLFLILFVSVYQIELPLKSSPLRLRSFLTELRKKVDKAEQKNIEKDYHFNIDGEKVRISRNNIGFNSNNDYYRDSISDNEYAIIGDSFVDSKVCGIDNSIASLLEKRIGVKVYNFGVAGGNIHNYNEIYEKYDLKRLKRVFIMITGTNDLLYSRKNESDIKYSDINIINRIHTIVKSKNNTLNKPNYFSIKGYDNVIYILHDQLSKESLQRNNVMLPTIEVDIASEYRYSDGHYNEKGNDLIVDQILSKLQLTD